MSASTFLDCKYISLVQVTDQPRILVLTGIWDAEASAVRLTFHVCKPAGATFEVNAGFGIYGCQSI